MLSNILLPPNSYCYSRACCTWEIHMIARSTLARIQKPFVRRGWLKTDTGVIHFFKKNKIYKYLKNVFLVHKKPQTIHWLTRDFHDFIYVLYERQISLPLNLNELSIDMKFLDAGWKFVWQMTPIYKNSLIRQKLSYSKCQG